MRKNIFLNSFLAIVVLIALCGPFLTANVVSAAPALDVTNALAKINIVPGHTYTHSMIIRNTSSAPLDIQVDPMGFGQTLDGSYVALAKEDDKSPYSAREYITQIDKTSVHLDPDASENVTATITVPSTIDNTVKYAIIYIHSQPSGEGRVGVIVAANVPVILVPAGVNSNDKNGKITSVETKTITSGEPITIDTTFQNTGTYYFAAKNGIKVTDAAGKTVLSGNTTLTSSSIIPTFSYMFSVPLYPSDPTKGLEKGTYNVESKVLLDDGTVLDTQESTFKIDETYSQIPKEIQNSTVVTKTYNDEEPTEIDAIKEADVRVDFEGAGKVTGSVIIAKYSSKPSTAVEFEAAKIDGGTGGKAIKYIDIRVISFTKGTAQITVYFTDDEVASFDKTTLYLAYFDGSVWRKLDDLRVYTEANYITGEIPVSALTGTVIGLGGAPQTVATQSNIAFPISWWIVAVIIIPVIIIGVLIFFWISRKKPSLEDDEKK